ncbi:MAG: hypothetical protein AABX80_01830, partial [Nanoarchaeota archaeon]
MFHYLILLRDNKLSHYSFKNKQRKMVYKRYIKRDGKLFGPYYYESYRDENGIPRSKKIEPSKGRFPNKLIYILIIFSLFLTASFI